LALFSSKTGSICTVFGPGFPYKLGQSVVLTFSYIAMNIAVLLLLFKKKSPLSSASESEEISSVSKGKGSAVHCCRFIFVAFKKEKKVMRVYVLLADLLFLPGRIWHS
jgi:hypothetical protein